MEPSRVWDYSLKMESTILTHPFGLSHHTTTLYVAPLTGAREARCKPGVPSQVKVGRATQERPIEPGVGDKAEGNPDC